MRIFTYPLGAREKPAMAALSQRDLRCFLEVLQRIYAVHNLEAFRREVIAALSGLVRAESISYNEVNIREGRATWLIEPDDGGFLRYRKVFDEHIGEHPLIRHYARTGDTSSLKISDFLSQRQFHSLGLYRNFFRQIAIEHQLAVTLPVRVPEVIGIAFNRTGPDFSERDRLCLDLLRPHLIQAYLNAKELTEREQDLALLLGGFEDLRRGVVLLDARNRVRLMTSTAQQSLAEIFGTAWCKNGRLPDNLERWLRQVRQSLSSAGVAPPGRSLVFEREGKHLVVRIVPHSSERLLLIEQRFLDLPPGRLRFLGLTAREAQVLAWTCRGKTNADIAEILALSRRTVEKHMERIFQKLGVETRTAAVALAQQLAGSGGLSATDAAGNPPVACPVSRR
jgi:DNA-binding CsgD family transcriptional regulator